MSDILYPHNCPLQTTIREIHKKLLHMRYLMNTNSLDKNTKINAVLIFESCDKIFHGLKCLINVINSLEKSGTLPLKKTMELNSFNANLITMTQKLNHLLQKLVTCMTGKKFIHLNSNIPEIHFQLLKLEHLYKTLNYLITSIEKLREKESQSVRVITSTRSNDNYEKLFFFRNFLKLFSGIKCIESEFNNEIYYYETAYSSMFLASSIILKDYGKFIDHQLIFISKSECKTHNIMSRKLTSIDTKFDLIRFIPNWSIVITNHLELLSKKVKYNLKKAIKVKSYLETYDSWNYEVLSNIAYEDYITPVLRTNSVTNISFEEYDENIPKNSQITKSPINPTTNTYFNELKETVYNFKTNSKGHKTLRKEAAYIINSDNKAIVSLPTSKYKPNFDYYNNLKIKTIFSSYQLNSLSKNHSNNDWLYSDFVKKMWVNLTNYYN